MQESHPDLFHEIGNRAVHSQNAPRESAVFQTRFAVLDDDDLSAELAFAVREPFRPHRVRNQRQFILVLALDQKLNRGHGNVNGIGDQLAVKLVV